MASEWTAQTIDQSMAAIIDYRGKTPRKTKSGVPLITAKVVKGGRIENPDEFIAEADYMEWMRRGIPEGGDVVVTTEAPLGEVAQLGTERVALAQRLICLRGKPGIVNNEFLKFLMQSDAVQEQLHSRATGTTVLGIKQSELRKVVLRLPPTRLSPSRKVYARTELPVLLALIRSRDAGDAHQRDRGGDSWPELNPSQVANSPHPSTWRRRRIRRRRGPAYCPCPIGLQRVSRPSHCARRAPPQAHLRRLAGQGCEEVHRESRLTEESLGGEVLVYEAPDGGVRIDVRLDRDTVWLTQDQMSGLFGRERSVITKHVRNVFRDGELDPGATCAKFAQGQIEGGRTVNREIDHYNLDVIISVGCRVKSAQSRPPMSSYSTPIRLLFPPFRAGNLDEGAS